MRKYPYNADIELSRLRIDLRNPRFPNEPDSQREAFENMADVQGAKLLALCKHIAHHGLSPAQQFIVIPDDPDQNQFIVLDANRRLTALRALENPDLVASRMSDADMRQLRLLADSYEAPDYVPCVVFAKREDAEVWIELLHDGESEGAGLVRWSAQQKARHRARGGTKAPHLQVLDFVARAGTLSHEAQERYERGTYPVSTLERALTTPHVRKKLGIQVADGQVQTNFPKSEILKGLTKVADEIGRGAVKVDKLMKLGDRVTYINAFEPEDLPDPSARIAIPVNLDEAPEQPKQVGKPRDKKPSGARTKLIPNDFSVSIGRPRVNDIYDELKRKLRVDEVPNATGVLLRVFLELSVDEYMDRHSVPLPKDPTFARKVTKVADHMEDQNIMPRHDIVPVREAVKSDDRVNLATNLNALVHNRNMSISGTDLKMLWNRLSPFIEKLWA